MDKHMQIHGERVKKKKKKTHRTFHGIHAIVHLHSWLRKVHIGEGSRRRSLKTLCINSA